MRSKYFLLLALQAASTNARLIPRSNLEIRDPTFPEDTTTAFPPSPTTPAQILQQCLACQVVGQALNVCASVSPSFTALDPTQQAQCLCYSKTSWVPNVFDNAVESCANYASTAAPNAFGVLENLEKFCNNVGNVGFASVTAFTLAPSVNPGAGAISSYAASTAGGAIPPPAMTGYGGAGATSTANSGSTTTNTNTSPTSKSTTSPSKTISETDITITVGGASTSTAKGVARRVIPEAEVVWLGFAISLVFIFL